MPRINSRTKGHAFERLIANWFKQVYPNAKRGLQCRDGSEVCDVTGTPFWIECKRMRKVNIEKAFDQACEDSKGEKPILVISKSDRGEILVSLDLKTLKDLLIIAHENGWPHKYPGEE